MTSGFDVALAQPLNEPDLFTKEDAVAGYRDNHALMDMADLERN
jgi:hypothetical protein|tara:strand:+ start:1027 stop:1158 length:132 start_codon:yes stop_codon:yes gene_type:complete